MGSYVVVLAFLCFLCCNVIGASKDNCLRHGHPPVTRNRTLVSAGGNFALGFFRPGNSSYSFLGIWYNTINNTVIWVANRESPLPQDSEAVFTLGGDGNLLLLDGERNAIWSTNISGGGGGNSSFAQLLDTGDLVLKQGEKRVWESFNGDDSDTLMAGMRLKVNKKTGKRNVIRCWSSSDDPRPGKFSLGIDPKGSPQILIWKEDVPYSRSNLFQDGVFYSRYLPKLEYSAYYSFATKNHKEYFSYGYNDISYHPRAILTPSGHLQLMLRQKGRDKWLIQWQVPATKCDLYAHCGSFGVCEQDSSHSVCSCLKGFKPKSQKDWDKGKYEAGCVRSVELGCGEDSDEFMRLGLMKWPDHSYSMGKMMFMECKLECSRNCSCTAFAHANITPYSEANCINWFGDLVDLTHKYSAGFNDFGQDLHVRVHASELSWVCKKSTMSTATPVAKDDIELQQVSLQSIIDATNNFDYANKLGEGGFGPVYKGFLSEFGMVAIKRLSKQSSQGQEEFMNELKLIAKLQHTNLAWLNWKKGQLLEFVDPAIRESYDFLKIVRCIEVGLLCVQAIPTDRPAMLDVVCMLSNDPETPIPTIKEPAYVSSNSIAISSTSHPKSSGSSSKNEVTVSILEPR
nr:G-type lectin S-receptor-like serine/threonine-protein kinase At4g27290 [Ipomoea batatas]